MFQKTENQATCSPNIISSSTILHSIPGVRPGGGHIHDLEHHDPNKEPFSAYTCKAIQQTTPIRLTRESKAT